MDIRLIRNEEDYKWALTEINNYFNNPPEEDTVEGDRFRILVILTEIYEKNIIKTNEPNPVEPAEEEKLRNHVRIVFERTSFITSNELFELTIAKWIIENNFTPVDLAVVLNEVAKTTDGYDMFERTTMEDFKKGVKIS